MKKIYGILILTLLVFSACTNEDGSIAENEVEIKDQVAQGMVASGVEFTHTSALCKNEKNFDVKGYNFYMNDEDITCGTRVTKVSFFIESSGALEIGSYKGKGPYIHYDNSTSSFMGCDVIITNVTDTTIEGKVKGGDDEMYIEGKFSAKLCD